MYYDSMSTAIQSMVTEAKGEISNIIIIALGIWAFIWGVQVFKAAVDEKERKKYELDVQIDDYLSSDDEDKYFSKYGPDDDD